MRRLIQGMTFVVLASLPFCATEAQTTLTYQPGVDGYEGLFDLIIGRNNTGDDVDLEFGDGNVLGSEVPYYFLDGRYGNFFESADEKQGLFHFDGILDDIPVGAKIISATFELTTSTVGNAQTGGPYGVCQLTVPFDDTTTYNNTDDGMRFHQGETDYPVDDSFGVADVGETIAADVTDIVQSWVDGAPNYGVAVTAGTTNGWSICLSGNPDTAQRPKLTVVYTLDNPIYEMDMVVQDPADADTSSYWVKTLTDEWIDGDTVSPFGEYLDGLNGTSPEDQAMMKFDNLFESEGGFVPDGATIVEATLVITTSNYEFRETGNVGSPGPWAVRQVLTDWDGSSSYGAMNFGPFMSDKFALITDAQAKFDVTSIVQNWQAGDDNYGFNVAQNGTSDGWCILFSAALEDAPKLIIKWEDFVLGDANGDGEFNNADIEAFVLALLDRAAFEAMYPDVDPDTVLDFSGDGSFGNEDIEGFVDALLG